MSIMFQALSTFIAAAIFGFVSNWRISIVTMAFMPIIITAVAICTKVVSSQLKGDKFSTEKAAKLAVEAISNIRTVASLHQEEYFFEKYKNYLETQIRYVSYVRYLFKLYNGISVI